MRPRQPGFFPAIQHFTDAITALPLEVVRHDTLLAEVEAKIHAPSADLLQSVDMIDSMPIPTNARHAGQQDLISLTANNSIAGSLASPEPELDTRRQRLLHIRMLVYSILGNLDEKNVCLADANRTLDRQLARINKVMPYVEAEISKEARLGSTTHWAYDKRETRLPAAMPTDTAHEMEIAAVRAEPAKKVKRPEVKRPEVKRPDVKRLEKRPIKPDQKKPIKIKELKVKKVATRSPEREREKERERSRSRHILRQIASFNRSPIMGIDNDDDARGRQLRRSPSSSEPRYCYCQRPSYGTMIACEHGGCHGEWFHLECTGLKAVPKDHVKWYCDTCRLMAMSATIRQ